MILSDDKIWAGSETSLQSAVQSEAHILTKIAAAAPNAQPDADPVPRLLSIADGIATITISGPLVNSDSEWLEMFGLTGYPEIRSALLAAANDPDVDQILLDIDSGGGSVSGVDDTANLIRSIHANVKPVTTYTDGVMASAAYWLGCSAGEVYSGKAAMVGSIGVIATFREFTEANKMDGVTVTVIRAGKEKALANSNEKLTPEARAQIQQMVDASYVIFVDHVAAMRGQPYAVADKKMADGQEFIGKAAADVGLTDGVTTFDAVVTDLKGKILAYKDQLIHNRGNGGKSATGRSTASTSGEADMARRKALTEQDIAAIAAGGTVDAAALDVSAEVITEAIAAAAAAAAADVAEVALAAEAVVSQKGDTISETVQLLNSQLLAKDEQLLQAGIKNARLEEQITEAQATHAPMLEIAVRSINNMRVALRHPAVSFEGQSAASIVSEHTRLSKQFQAEYKAGGIAAVSADDATAAQPQVDPRHLARVNAARYTPN